MIDDQPFRPGIVFGTAVDPLPLIDPTSAAKRLGLRRHTLACYRNLGEGPAYYKFGRWIRYTAADLKLWSYPPIKVMALRPRLAIDPAHALALIDTAAAARFLTITIDCLKHYRKINGGPRARQFGRRVYYSVADLHGWAEAQRVEAIAPMPKDGAGGRARTDTSVKETGF